MGRPERNGSQAEVGTQLAVAYLRVSTDEQVLGLEAQRAALEAWAESAHVTIVAWHTDRGVSGATPGYERPELAQALAALTTHCATILLVAKRDRLARDVLIALTVEREVKRRGATIISADGTGNGTSPADEFMRTILDAAAAYERGMIRARTRAALAAKRARGEAPGGETRYGFQRRDGEVLPCYPEQLVIERARALRSSGEPLRVVADVLTREGARSRAGTPFAITQVHRMTA